ncbi:MAG: hypothetical protein ACTSWN_10440 [Promethearchaeota archaeon]
MKVIKSGKRRIRPFMILIFIISIPSCLGILYISKAIYLYQDLVSFQYEAKPDPSTFVPANYTRMAEMAEYYDSRFEMYHIPLNMSTDTIFSDDNCTQVSRYAFSDNTGQWTGLAITSWVFKYVAAIKEHDDIMKNNSLRVIRKLLHGMSMQLAVPNGGLGSNYSGILARGWAGPEHRGIPGVEWYFSNGGGRHHNGTGPYSNYRWRGYTSNDEYSGFYAGLAMVFKYVKEPDVQELVKLMIDQVANYMILTNFLGIDWDGSPTGVHQRAYFFHGGTWTLLLLKLAALALPEKYERYYDHYVSEDFYAMSTAEGGEHETVANYYAHAFGYHISFALLMLEENEPLHSIYLNNFEDSLEKYTKHHRNPFFNMIRLIVHQNTSDVDVDNVKGDIEDILMRYDCPYHFPDRMLGHADIPSDYEEISNIDQLNEFLDDDPFGALYEPLFMEVRTQQRYYNKPLTPEYRNGNIFIWEKNPYQYFEPQINPRYEFAGFSFSLVYWMGRANGYFPAPAAG